MLEQKEIKEKLKILADKYPDFEKVDLDYYGSGDSFESYDVNITPCSAENYKKINNEDFEELFWDMVERADSNFNNDGSRGTVTFNLKELTISIDDYCIYIEEAINYSQTF